MTETYYVHPAAAHGHLAQSRPPPDARRPSIDPPANYTTHPDR